ncbi:MAG: putative hydro-lyase [Alphaproteobacteria bacterium]|nr:putative hydro-lyase [Alphaproteobacteria bacterium]
MGVDPVFASPAALREAARSGQFTALTTGHVPGYVQANLAVLPAEDATDFIEFCRRNARACPVLGVSKPGDPSLPDLGANIDVRTDLPSYWVYRNGRRAETVGDISGLWQDDHVAVAIGCWFSVEDALQDAGVRLRHVELGIQGGLFRTGQETVAVGKFGGPMVASMRPFAAEDVETVAEVTGRFERVHGAPIHVGAPDRLGIADISKPDFGEQLVPEDGEVPVYWGCGLTALSALEHARLPLFITHAAGAMLVTDLRNSELETG